jgi:hypothetical protein
MTTDTLASGASLTAGQSLVSANGIYTLIVSPNGLVYMQNIQSGARYWVVGKLGQGNPILSMLTNGNLILKEGNPQQQQWASGTQQFAGAYACILGNGNLVIYDAGGDVVWSAGAAQGAVVVAPAALVEMRAAFENALTKLSLVERAFLETNVAIPGVADVASASVNAPNYGSAE